jgi:hypothetical protein
MDYPSEAVFVSLPIDCFKLPTAVLPLAVREFQKEEEERPEGAAVFSALKAPVTSFVRLFYGQSRHYEYRIARQNVCQMAVDGSAPYRDVPEQSVKLAWFILIAWRSRDGFPLIRILVFGWHFLHQGRSEKTFRYAIKTVDSRIK